LSFSSEPLDRALSEDSVPFSCSVSFHSDAFSIASCELVLISSRISFPDFGANRSATEAPTTLPISEPNKKSFVLNSLLFDLFYLFLCYFFFLFNFKSAVPFLTAWVAFSTSSVDVFEILDDKVLID